MKILIPISGAAGVFFPIGKPPKGTCKFADKDCLNHCTAIKDKGYDEEYRVTEAVKKKIHEYFINENPLKLCFRILQEMAELRVNILHWFISGDCLPEDQGRMLKIINLLKEGSDIVQMGFTRNKNFWQQVRFETYIVLTCNSTESIPTDYKDLIYAIPDYKNKVTDLYTIKEKEGIRYGGCSGTYIDYINYPSKMSMTEILHNMKNMSVTNCKRCFRKKQGCFYKMEERNN